MLAVKTLTEYTNLFSPNNFKKIDDIIPNIYRNLNVVPLNANISNEQQFRPKKINDIKDYF